MSTATVQSSTPVKPAWGALPKRAATTAPPRSLAEIQQEEQTNADAELALRLHLAEQGVDVEAQRRAEAAVQAMKEREAAERREAEAAAMDPEVQDDLALAMALQAEFDAEHNQRVFVAEHRANLVLGNNSKVTVSMAHHRTVDSRIVGDQYEPESGDSDNDSDEDSAKPRRTVYDKNSRMHRDVATGGLITKHDADITGRRNRKRVDQLPLSFPSGDMSGADDIKLSNKVFNHMKRFSDRAERSRRRLRDQKDVSTHAMALDANTRLILYRLVNAGYLKEVHGAFSMGKESVVFHGTNYSVPEDLESPLEECAIKVFKTTLTEFKQRQQFLQGDRRFDARVGKQCARKLVKIWSEKEMANLSRMQSSSIACPRVIVQRKHVLVMSFIGSAGRPAPKLKEVQMKGAELRECYDKIVDSMCKLHNECKLVHADLSEYNILIKDGEPYFIDVGQSVEPSHARARQYLYRDCANITNYFTKIGLDGARTPAELFRHISQNTVTPEEEVEFMVKINQAKGGDRSSESDEETSRVCTLFENPVTAANKEALLEGIDPALVVKAENDEVGEEEEEEEDDDDESFVEVGSDESDFVLVDADAAAAAAGVDDNKEEEEEEEEEEDGADDRDL